MASGSQEAVVIRGYLDTCISLPWNKYSKDQTNIKKRRSRFWTRIITE